MGGFYINVSVSKITSNLARLNQVVSLFLLFQVNQQHLVSLESQSHLRCHQKN